MRAKIENGEFYRFITSKILMSCNFTSEQKKFIIHNIQLAENLISGSTVRTDLDDLSSRIYLLLKDLKKFYDYNKVNLQCSRL